MNPLPDPLAELRPLHLPVDIGWWPPAPGWWMLVLLLIALAAWATVVWRRGSARREALRVIGAVEQTDLAGPMLAQEINLLLRRYAIACFPHHDAASLTGQSWLEFLHRHGAGGDFRSASAQALTGAAFAAHADVDRDALIGLARGWIKHNCQGSKHNPKDAGR